MPEASQPTPQEPPLPAASAALTEAEASPAPALTFWRQYWVQNILPWITSIVIHAALIILVLATYQAAGKFLKVIQEQIVIPDASLAPDPGGVPNPGMDNQSVRSASQNLDSSVTESSGFAQVRSNLNEQLINTPTNSASDDSGQLLGAAAAAGRGENGAAGGSETTSGALAQFGNPGGGQIGPRGRVFGHGGNAMRIVYICDASGSMLSKMDLLKRELQTSVQQLQPVQAFDVIFFQDSIGNPTSQIDLAPDLVMATASNKRKLYTFLGNIVAQSTTHVIPALTTAFRLDTKPELIYLLTDGAFEDETSPVVIDAIRKLNADKRVHINPVLLLGKMADVDPDELKEASDAMKTIARENGGVYNQVSIDELDN